MIESLQDTHVVSVLHVVSVQAFLCLMFSVHMVTEVLRQQIQVTVMVIGKFFLIHLMNLVMLQTDMGVWGIVLMVCIILHLYDTLPIQQLPAEDKVVLITGWSGDLLSLVSPSGMGILHPFQ